MAQQHQGALSPERWQLGNQTVAEHLRRIGLFSDWGEHDLMVLARAAQRRHRSKGELILLQDEPGNVGFLILRGAVDIVLERPDGREFRLARLGPGDHFGEMALISPQPRSATVIAATDTELLVVRREDFIAELLAHPPAMLRLLASLTERLRHTDAQVGSLAFEDTATRLAHFLTINAAPQPGVHGVDISQTEVATLVGASRQTVARIFGDWRDRGYITTSRKKTIVLQPAELAAISGR